MTDLDTLLSQAAHSPTGPASDATVDADLARGRRALTHRRMRRTGTRSVLAGALAIGAFAAYSPGSHPSTGTTAGKPVTSTATTKAPTLSTTTAGKSGSVTAGIKLVAYTGEQPEGYTVDSVPAGWEIQGVNDFALAIAPVGFADQSIDSFRGKIVVMLQSMDAKPLTPAQGNTVAVGNGTGIVSNFDRQDGLQLNYKDATSGKWVMVQAPLSLHWTDAQLGTFAAGVHVNASAQAGRG